MKRLEVWGLRFGVCSLLLATAGCGDAGEFANADEPLGESNEGIIDGTELPDFSARNSGVLLMNGACSSTLLDKRWVLTAAHCFGYPDGDALVDVDHDGYIDRPQDVNIRFGNANDASAVVIAAQKILRHPQGYWGSGIGMDVALIQLSQDAPAINTQTNHFSNGKMLLYPAKNATLQGKQHTLIGYGKNVRGYGPPYTGSGTLRFGTRKVTSTSDSVLWFAPEDTTFSPNNGDSGGPSFYDLFGANSTLAARFVTGVTSTTTSYTGTEAFRDWASKTAWGKIPVTIRNHSGFSNPNQLIDHDTNSVSVDNDKTAWVELDLGGDFQLTELKMAEDNAGEWKVGSYSVQCWNGSSFAPALFNDTQTDAVIPRFDEHPIANGCTTSRVRVNFDNPPGPVEVFELEVYGTPKGTRTINVQSSASQCQTTPAPASYAVSIGENRRYCAEDCGDFLFKGWTLTGDVRATDRTQRCIDLSDVRENVTLKAEFRQHIGITATASANGTIGVSVDPNFSGGGFLAEVGTNIDFYTWPNPGYRTSQVCPSRTGCQAYFKNWYTLTNVGSGNDFWFTADFELADVKAKHSGKCLDAKSAGTANGTQIQQWDCNANQAQWLTRYPLDSASSKFGISHPKSGRCLDISGASKANGAKVQLWDCNENTAQQFVFEDRGSNYYRIKNVNSNKCLDVTGASSASGAVVTQWDCSESNNQRFRFPY